MKFYKRKYKETPLCYKCLDLFKEKRTLSISEIEDLFEKKYGYRLQRKRIHSHISRLHVLGYVENCGLTYWRLVKS